MEMAMTKQNKPTKRTFFVIPAVLLMLFIGLQSAYAGDFGYQATNPDGGEVKKAKGDFWTYLGGLLTSSKHVDRIIYLTDTNDFSVGVGYYDWTNSGGTESYLWLRYWDEGGVNSNFHYLSSTGPSSEGWHSIEVYEVDSNTYDFKVDGSSLNTLDCSTTCDDPTIAGVASWGSSTSSSDFVRADFKNLQLDDAGDADSGYISWNTESTDYKCNNWPSSLKFVLPLTGNSIDQVQIDVGSVDECSVNSDVWLYNGGSGG